MSNNPFIAHSEITNEIYIICGKMKYCVTKQVISAMKATGRLNERPQGEWIRQGKGDDCRCSECGCSAMYFSQLDEDEQEVFGTLTTDWCPWCGADMKGGRE